MALADEAGRPVAVLEVEGVYDYDKQREAELAYRTTDTAHPGVARLDEQKAMYLAGKVTVFERATPAFPELAMDPADTRAAFAGRGWRGSSASRPATRSTARTSTSKAALETSTACCSTRSSATRSRTTCRRRRASVLRRARRQLLPGRPRLVAASAAMRYAGPREAIFHAICRKNYGCSHFIVGRDHAGVGDYYGTYDAQLIFDEFEPHELGIEPMFFEQPSAATRCGAMASREDLPARGGGSRVPVGHEGARDARERRAAAGRVLAARGRRGADRGL